MSITLNMRSCTVPDLRNIKSIVAISMEVMSLSCRQIWEIYQNFKQNLFSFFKGILHVSYAPENETVADVREKLKSRKQEVQYRLNKLKQSANESIKRPSSFQDSEDEPLTKHIHLPTWISFVRFNDVNVIYLNRSHWSTYGQCFDTSTECATF